MKKISKKTFSFVNEEKRWAKTRTEVSSKKFPIKPFTVEGFAQCHEVDTFDVAFGKKLSALRSLRTASKLTLRQMKKVAREAHRNYLEALNTMIDLEDNIENLEVKINELIESKKV